MASVNDIGIDLGTSNIIIYMKGRGIILNEPMVIAIDRTTRDILAFGEEAGKYVGRTPSNIITLSPLRTGSIKDPELVNYMLRAFIQKAIGKHLFSKPRAILAVPSGVTEMEMEKRALASTMFDAGMRKTQLINRTVSAALGAGLPLDEAYGTMVVDISAGVTDIAVLSSGEYIIGECVNKVAGDSFDEAIIRYLRTKHSLEIGQPTAEKLKIEIASAIPRTETVFRDVIGRSLITGLPKSLRVTSDEIFEAIHDPLQQLIEAIQSVLEHTPAQLAADIFDYGILLSGGGAAMFGLCEAIANELDVPCTVTEDPQKNVVMGCAKVLDNMRVYGRYLEGNRKRPVSKD